MHVSASPALPNRIYFGDNLPILQALPSGLAHLIYIDPPFNTGRVQARNQWQDREIRKGDRDGFAGKRMTKRSGYTGLHGHFRRLPGLSRATAGRSTPAAQADWHPVLPH